MEKRPGIYKIAVGDVFYYGQASNLQHRRGQHLASARNGKHRNKHVQAAYDETGSIEFQTVLVCEVDELDRYEQFFLDKYWGHEKCANIARHAKTPARGYRHTEEARRKIAEANLGSTLTPEAKAKCAEAARKAWQDPDHRAARISKMRGKGKPMTSEALAARKERVKNPLQVTLEAGEVLTFDRSQEAADHFGAHVVAVNRWIKGNRKPHKSYGIAKIRRVEVES